MAFSQFKNIFNISMTIIGQYMVVVMDKKKIDTVYAI